MSRLYVTYCRDHKPTIARTDCAQSLKVAVIRKKVRTEEYTTHVKAIWRDMRFADACVSARITPRLDDMCLHLACEDGEALMPFQLNFSRPERARALTVIKKVNCKI